MKYNHIFMPSFQKKKAFGTYTVSLKMCYLFHKHIYLVFGLINFQCPCCSGCYAAYFCLIFKKIFTFAPLLCFSLSFLCANILDSSSLCVSLLPVCPSLSFPHPRQFTLFPSPAFNICRFASIDPFNPCFPCCLLSRLPSLLLCLFLWYPTFPQKT